MTDRHALRLSILYQTKACAFMEPSGGSLFCDDAQLDYFDILASLARGGIVEACPGFNTSDQKCRLCRLDTRVAKHQ